MTVLDIASTPLNTERAVSLIRTEYLEMPGLNLTKPQMQRFMGVDVPTCDEVLRHLEQTHFLKKTAKDAYVRA